MEEKTTFSVSARLPMGMKGSLSKMSKKTPYGNTRAMLNAYLEIYIEKPDEFPLPKEDILKYENLEKEEKDFTFKAKIDMKEKYEREIMVNLTTGRNYTKKFIYSVYNKLIAQT